MFKKLVISVILCILPKLAYGTEIQTDFFSHFNDPDFYAYIMEALNNNPGVKAANARTEEYRQQVKYSFGNELPSLSVSANYLGIKVPELDNFQLKENAFVLPFMVSYEPDFLLKNRDKTRAAKKEYEAMAQNEKAVYISLLSDVANAYLNILQYDRLIKNQIELVKINKEILAANSKKLKSGTIDTNSYNISFQNFENSKNELSRLKAQKDEILYQFAALIGKNSDTDLKRGNFENFEYEGEIPNAISSDIIFNRPDVKYAEYELEKARIEIRAARKEFLPSFNITGIWTFNSLARGTFFSWESSLAALLAGATQDIFQGGKKAANLKIKKSRYKELFEKYRETDLNAVKEINTALCCIKYDTDIENGTKSNLKTENQNFSNSNKKYSLGLISTPEILADKIKLIEIENNAIKSKTKRLADYFTLYKAVGGSL